MNGNLEVRGGRVYEASGPMSALSEQARAEERSGLANPFRRFLVATDGSADGNRAVSFAVSLAHQYQGELELCYALDYGRAFAECSTVNGSIGLVEPLVHELEESAKSILADASLRAAAAGVDSTSSLLNGNPAEAIARRAIERNVGAIVMGTTGKQGLDRFFLGSVADGVLRRSNVPTFVVPASASSNVALKCFLVAVDDSEPSAAAAAFAVDLARAVNARIIFVGVVETVGMSDEAVLYGSDPVPMLKELKARTASRLALETDRALRKSVACKSIVSDGVPAERILELAKVHDVDLTIVGTHGRRGLKHLLLGSVAEAIVCRSRTPVAVVPARYGPAIEEAPPSSGSGGDSTAT